MRNHWLSSCLLRILKAVLLSTVSKNSISINRPTYESQSMAMQVPSLKGGVPIRIAQSPLAPPTRYM